MQLAWLARTLVWVIDGDTSALFDAALPQPFGRLCANASASDREELLACQMQFGQTFFDVPSGGLPKLVTKLPPPARWPTKYGWLSRPTAVVA
jgi:hypothetical protein